MENNLIRIEVEKLMHTIHGPLNLSIKTSILKGELVSLFGQSGTGKTTLLRILAGLTEPDCGFISFGNEIWFDSKRKINLSPQQRRISFMFQDYALFPNMTVGQNIRYAQPSPNQAEIERLLETLNLTEFKNKKPTRLSGGQQQRVALARALARKPQLLLLDEPLSALDAEMRTTLQDEISDIHRNTGLTTILVSHDLNEVFRLASQVLCIENGKITRNGKPEDVFLDSSISGKVQITGKIARIHRQETINIVTVITGNNQIIKVIAFDNDLENLKPGDQVMVYSKAFNPIISKINQS